MRIVEVMLALILMLLLMTTLVQRNPLLPQSTKNTRVLQRYAEDMKNMVCNSEKDNILVLTADDLTSVNNSLKYVVPSGMKFNVQVFQDDSILVKSQGFGLPDLASTKDDVATASCLLGNETVYLRTVVVHAWY